MQRVDITTLLLFAIFMEACIGAALVFVKFGDDLLHAFSL